MEVNPSPAAAAAALREGRSAAGGPEQDLLPLIRQVVSPEITAVDVEAVKSGAVADVFRLVPKWGNGTANAAGAAPAAHLIVKRIRPDAETDPFGRDREANFYASVYPRLGFARPAVHYTGCDPITRARVVVMDALYGYRHPLRTHRWTPAEAHCFVRAYARLHEAPVAPEHVDAAWLVRILSSDFNRIEIEELAGDLVRRGVWTPIPDLGGLVEWVGEAGVRLEGLPASYLHGDVFPPNIPLPEDLTGEAVLIDWDMAGVGPAEMDLGFMFLQPFASAADLDRGEVMDAYWAARERLGGEAPPPAERRLRQRFADALWGLYLVRVAHRSVFDPFPPGSPSDRYWDAMRVVLHRWLERIGESANRRIF